MIRKFVLVYVGLWIFIYALDALLPAESIFSHRLEVIFLNGVYVLISSLVAIILSNTLFNGTSTNHIKLRIEGIGINLLMKWLISISLIGAVCFFYDKVFVQGIDYTQGLASGRYQLQANREGASGISSIASAIGYIFGAFSFFLYALTFTFFEKITSRTRIFGFLVSVITIAVISFLTGGRTSILLLFGISTGCIIIRKLLDLKWVPFNKIQMSLATAFIFGGLLYLIFVFQSRADANNKLAHIYTIGMISHMNGNITQSFNDLSEISDDISSYVYFGTLVGVYATHSNWTFEGVLELTERKGNAMFLAWRNLLAKFGLMRPSKEWEFYGIFISWPGGVYHDYGHIGLLIFAIIHGILITLTKQMIYQYGINVLTMGFFMLISIITFSSPFILASDVLMFPTLTISIPLIFILSRFIGHQQLVKFEIMPFKSNFI